MQARRLQLCPHAAGRNRGDAIGTLTVRQVPEEVIRSIRIRAAKAGRSMEAEVRAILERASLEPEGTMSVESLQSWVAELYRVDPPKNVVEELIAERRRETAKETWW